MAKTMVGLAVVLFTGCGGAQYRLAPGATGAIPPPWHDCTNPRSDNPSVVAVRGWAFEALAPGKATIECKERSVTMEVGAIARVEIDGPTEPVWGHVFLSLEAYDRHGEQLSLFDAEGVVWTLPEGADYYDFCGHGEDFCDAAAVQGVSAGPGTYRIRATYRGHVAVIDLQFTDIPASGRQRRRGVARSVNGSGLVRH